MHGYGGSCFSGGQGGKSLAAQVWPTDQHRGNPSELVRNTKSQALLQICRMEICILIRSPGNLYAHSLEKHHPRGDKDIVES